MIVTARVGPGYNDQELEERGLTARLTLTEPRSRFGGKFIGICRMYLVYYE